MSAAERTGIAGGLRIVRRHAWPMFATFAIVATLSGLVAEMRWRQATATTPRPAVAAPTQQGSVESSAAGLLRALGPVFDVELESTQAQIAERDAALAALDAEVASGPTDQAARAARLAGARRRVTTLAEAIARDRVALVALQATPAPVPVPPDPDVVAATQSVDEAEARLVELERRLMPQHPDVVKQRGVLRERQALAAATAAGKPPAPATDDTEDRARRERTLVEQIAEQETEQRRAAAIVASLEGGSSVADATVEERDRLVRERDALKAVYAALEAKRADLMTRANAMAESAAATVLADSDAQAAAATEAPRSPRQLSAPWLAFTAGGALLLALIVGVTLDARDTRIHDVIDLQAVTQAQLLVTVSEIVATGKNPKPTEREISMLPEPSTPTLIWHPQTPRRAIEQYRRLAQALRRIRVDRQTRVIGVTSALPGEGKTLTAVNLAVSLAESYRQRVLIIDADLRRPTVARLLALAPQEGLADWLRHDDGRECPMLRLTSRLSVIPAGTPGNDPTPLLTSMRMAWLIAAARADFDWVVVDTPPTGLIADAGAIEGSLDGFVVVAAAGRTSAPALRQTIEALGADRVLGVVLNRMKNAGGAESDAYSDYYSMPSVPQ